MLQDTREKKWRVQAVSVQPGSFENRRSLPAAWRGLRDDELSGIAGIPGDCCVVLTLVLPRGISAGPGPCVGNLQGIAWPGDVRCSPDTVCTFTTDGRTTQLLLKRLHQAQQPQLTCVLPCRLRVCACQRLHWRRRDTGWRHRWVT
jgi:Uncharacterised protein family (UPF0160)